MGEKFFVIFNTSAKNVTFSPPESTWNPNIFDTTAGNNIISQFSKSIHVAPISATILTHC